MYCTFKYSFVCYISPRVFLNYSRIRNHICIINRVFGLSWGSPSHSRRYRGCGFKVKVLHLYTAFSTLASKAVYNTIFGVN